MIRPPGLGGLFTSRQSVIPSELVTTIGHHEHRVDVRVPASTTAGP